eukprot:CAMPEP_0113392688 /NCGR_PEP_ID=MMETSP0013_2-20120614/11430_1 /TAXON_ID=2843 ORGANISM="Skeletonema costatum, Strain 1716" /NCGR_SAMPLE_ID=MMETSP0013_2 /ASSEMBLY_ACC=CAM_ASM_000158 /LENGTH=156 /DNA_ID=CAMNT_0000276121 /DNA_START=20 /DNA_END=490 /DNA_ORIENTATION=- /assembly_acc=CAM_ASM_000158
MIMNRRFFAVVGSLLIAQSSAFSGGKSSTPIINDCPTTAAPVDGRRAFLTTTASSFAAILFTNNPANAAAPDCFKDCIKECKLIAPKDPEYCQSSCSDYCSQTDRKDGLSGSVSSENGETGILGTTTVVKGEDKPPQLKIPGLDFTSDKGKKLLGY